jgi:phosphotriesterase-related protein
MKQINTVNGPVSTADLGRTYMHEHIFVLTPEIQSNYPEEWGSEDDRVNDAVTRLRALAAQGVRTIFDLTVVGLGRDVARIRRVAQQVPELNIVVATGLYTFDALPRFFMHRGPTMSEELGRELPEPLVEMFERDIVDGIADTGVRAGMIKCAIDHFGLTPDVERIFRAVAEVHRRTGTPITVHTNPAHHSGHHVKRILCDEEGVDPQAIVLGHSGDTSDLDYLSEMADHGFLLGMDRFGILHDVPFEQRAETLLQMCARGYASSIVMSHDASCYIDWLGPEAAAMNPEWNYLHIGERVLPYVLERGITPEQVNTMLVDNPRRLLEFAPA